MTDILQDILCRYQVLIQKFGEHQYIIDQLQDIGASIDSLEYRVIIEQKDIKSLRDKCTEKLSILHDSLLMSITKNNEKLIKISIHINKLLSRAKLRPLAPVNINTNAYKDVITFNLAYMRDELIKYIQSASIESLIQLNTVL